MTPVDVSNRLARATERLATASFRRRVTDDDSARESVNGQDPQALYGHMRNLEARVKRLEARLPR